MHSERPKKKLKKRVHTHTTCTATLGFWKCLLCLFLLLAMATVGRTQWVVGQRKKLLPAAIPNSQLRKVENTFAQLPASYFRKQ